jgi:hypothetical protein
LSSVFFELINIKDSHFCSYALSVDDLGTSIIVIFLGNPVTSEGGEGTESSGTGPNGVVSVWGSNNLGHTSLGGLLFNLHVKSSINSFIKGGTTGKDDIGVEVSSDINVTIIDRLDGKLVETESFITLLGESRLEDKLGGLESRGVNIDNLTIGELEVFLMLVGGGSLTKGGLVVLSDEGSLLLDGSYDLLPGTGSTLSSNTVEGQELFHVLGDGSTSNEVLANGVGNGETFKDWHSVSNTISRVANDTSGTAVSVKGHDGLDGNIETID